MSTSLCSCGRPATVTINAPLRPTADDGSSFTIRACEYCSDALYSHNEVLREMNPAPESCTCSEVAHISEADEVFARMMASAPPVTPRPKNAVGQAILQAAIELSGPVVPLLTALAYRRYAGMRNVDPDAMAYLAAAEFGELLADVVAPKLRELLKQGCDAA